MRTTDVVKVKAIEDIFPRPDNYLEIKEDIVFRGIQEAMVVNSNNELLCGYTRLAIAQELSIDEIPHRLEEITELDDMVEFAILDNIRRRQLSDLQLVEYGIKLERLYGDRQGRSIKGGHNVHVCNGKTRDLVAGKIHDMSGVKMSGRKYDRLKIIATKAVKEVHDKLNAGEITQAEALALTKVGPDKQVKIIQSGLSNIARKVNIAIKRNSLKEKSKQFEIETIPDIEILAGDMAEVGKEIDDTSVDLILTDPPYPKEFLPLWQKLSDFADRVLKPSGFLVAYSGQVHLDKVIPILSDKLCYYWLIPLLHKGHTQLEYSRHVNCTYKPILVYAKLPVEPLAYFRDTIIGSGREKGLHKWQQGLAELYPLIEAFSDEDDLIVDPFAGSGTTLIAAYKKNRRAIGIEIDEENVEVIKGRFAEVIHDAIDDYGGNKNANGTRHVEII